MGNNFLIGARYDLELAKKRSDYARHFKDIDSLTLAAWVKDSSQYIEQITELKQAGFLLHGHPLIFRRTTQKFTSIEDMFSYLDRITEGYENLIDDWDVLNEVFDNGNLLMLCPEKDWALYAFDFVRNKFPKSKLWLNEFAIKNKTYWRGVLALAERLKRNGLLDGVGIQCHVDLRGKLRLSKNSRHFDYGLSHLLSLLPAPRLESEVKAIKALGLKVHFSEVSVKGFTDQNHCKSAIYKRFWNVAKSAQADKFTYWHLIDLKAVDGTPGYINLSIDTHD